MSESEDQEYEQVDLGLLLTADSELEREERCFRKSVNFGKIDRDIMSECRHCHTVNNMTENKSTFCEDCGSLLTDRHFKKVPSAK